MRPITWYETTPEVYFAIYNQHAADLRVNGTISHVDHPDYGFRMMTEWGLPGSSLPFMKIDEQRHGQTSIRRFYLAVVLEED